MHAKQGILAAASLCLLLSACNEQQATILSPQLPSNIKADLDFRGFLAQNIPEQDVYIETTNGSQHVTRFEVRPTENLDLMAFTFRRIVHGATTPQPHVFTGTGAERLGPFDKGIRIGVPLQLWGSARGYGTYVTQDGKATLQVDFHGLMKNGTYSLWCSKVSDTAIIEWPCVAPGQPGNPIKADPKGRAELEVSFDALPDSTTQTGAWLSLAYHSDHHKDAIKNDFGKHTHVHLTVKIPTPEQTRPAW